MVTKPAGVATWNGPYVKGEKVPEDPWNHPFVYRNPATRQGHDYDLCSLGSDGQPGGTGEAEDICN